jgi:plastocyanin
MKDTTWRVALAAGTLVAALTSSPASGANGVAVGIDDFAFTPRELTVPAGTTVTWTNHDEEPHTITSAAGAFGSAGLAHDEDFSRTFTDPGRYDYFCALHPHMKATVIVR